jgi:hypothetical protein
MCVAIEPPRPESSNELKVAIVWRGEPGARGKPIAADNRLRGVADALSSLGVAVEACVFSEDAIDDVRGQLLRVDGALVWVDPISGGRDRSQLDPLLRAVADAGVWVSAHPDVILKMGVKEVLYRTRDIGWGTDTDLYATPAEFAVRFPERLAFAGPRVVKQNRGNGGLGVWKVGRIGGAAGPLDADAIVRVLHAQRGSVEEDIRLGDFMNRCADYFLRGGRIIDQAFQPRLPEGMIRCYLSQNKVVGYGHQLIKALVAPPKNATPEDKTPGPRIMHAADARPFQKLRILMETDWVPAMQRVLDIDASSLPVIWDADFLYGPKTAAGEDTYVLCEINVSAVSPFPDQAPGPVARATIACIRAAKARGATNS